MSIIISFGENLLKPNRLRKNWKAELLLFSVSFCLYNILRKIFLLMLSSHIFLSHVGPAELFHLSYENCLPYKPQWQWQVLDSKWQDDECFLSEVTVANDRMLGYREVEGVRFLCTWIVIARFQSSLLPASQSFLFWTVALPFYCSHWLQTVGPPLFLFLNSNYEVISDCSVWGSGVGKKGFNLVWRRFVYLTKIKGGDCVFL